MSKNSALASLTATYTDSENEDDKDASPNSETSNASVAVGNFCFIKENMFKSVCF